jgi:hypothetical protein
MRVLTVVMSLGVLACAASPVAAQTPKAGVVTTLEGTVTATRAAAAPVALKFKDDVFYRDRITTAEQSLARMLLGGKAVVTVRERSVLTITEVPGRSTIEIDSGKFALAVARERMRPGEVIEIRTPNAVAGVRGSVIVTDVESPAGTPTVSSSLYVLQGSLSDAQPRDPTTRAGVGTPRTINTMEQFKVVGLLGTVLPIRPEQLGPIRAGLQPRSKPHDQAQGQELLATQQMQTAAALANALNTPAGSSALAPLTPAATPPLPTTAQPTNTIAPIIPLTAETQKALAEGTVPGTGTNGGALTGGLLTNPGFETGTLAGWTLTGGGGVVSAFGTLTPPEGTFMGLVHTRTGTALSGCGTGSDCTRSSLSQQFAVNSIVTVSAKGFLLSNEFPTFTSASSAFNDRYLLQLIDSTGATFTLFDQRVNETTFTASSFTATAFGFTLAAGGGIAAFDLGKKTQVIASGLATLVATISNVSDTLLDSGWLIDGVTVVQDPPRFFITSGLFAPSGTLLALANDTQRFDSVLMSCCGATVQLDGPALAATSSVLDVPFGVAHAIQGGRITSSSGGPLVQLDGGHYALGTVTSIFSAAGVSPDGSDEPLRHAGTFLDATGATIQTGTAMIVDAALLAATAPLLNLTQSTMTATDSVLDLSFRAKVTSLGPLFALNGSSLTVANGALVNLRNGSHLSVSGDLVRLANGSSLHLLNGPLLSVAGNSAAHVSGHLISFVGPLNTFTLNNNLCAMFACTKVGGLNVALIGGANANNVSIVNPIGGTGTVTMAPSAAAVVVSGAGSSVKAGN